MARELKQLRKFDFARRLVLIQVQDEFGTISHHSIPLTGDACPWCNAPLPGAQGSRDVEASAAAAIARVDAITDKIIPLLEAAAKDNPEILAQIEAAKLQRAATQPSPAPSNNPPSASVPSVPATASTPGGGSS